jgi:molybdate transport system substrate-binding protein
MTRPTTRGAFAVLVLAGASALASACGTTATPGATTSSAASSRQVTVYAAASLTESFTALGKTFEAAHPGVTVTFNFGPSSALATQVVEGAPADVFASASPKPMATVIDAKAAATSIDFATNSLAIAVPPDNPAKIDGLDDLAAAGVTVALCDSTVPCGSLADAVLSGAHVAVTPVSREVDVKAVLTKVRAGEVDAGLVYVTDVVAAGSAVGSVAIPTDVNGATTYPIAVLSASSEPALAADFVALVSGLQGRSVLTAAGFGPP